MSAQDKPKILPCHIIKESTGTRETGWQDNWYCQTHHCKFQRPQGEVPTICPDAGKEMHG